MSMARSEWANSLYGKFYGRTPSLMVVQQVMLRIWKIRCSVQVLYLAAGFFCFKFASAEDLNVVMIGGPWFLGGQALLLIPWRINFLPMMERIDSIPVWIIARSPNRIHSERSSNRDS
ncbi:hypothetical protein Cni_G09868 [Canna indica]|uniref:DUF4283 domain-containing protein n=1 Tax=Canna indica TaxID=4628 RepID=A0AAQ3Q838_9LILI|nr:hypothetical protein Cni_G09868 [Canna indica]